MASQVRKIIEIDEDLCNGCGNCIVDCEEGALEIRDGKAKLVSEVFCDGLGACIGTCPTGALNIVEREAAPFDEELVEEHLKKTEILNNLAGEKAAGGMKCGCPSAMMQCWDADEEQAPDHEPDHQPTARSDVSPIHIPSALRQWPIKIELISPMMEAFKNRDELLLFMDCVGVAHTTLHLDYLKDRPVITLCPKFGDSQLALQKLTHLLEISDFKKIVVLRMEVPCCGGGTHLAHQAVQAAGKEIEVEEKIIRIR